MDEGLDIEQVDRAIVIRKDGKFKRFPTPAGFTDALFRNAVAAADVAYRAGGVLPSPADCHRYWSKISTATFAELFTKDEFLDALRYRGVEFGEFPGLTHEQGFALLEALRPTNRPLGARLKEMGIPFAKWEAWLKQPLFFETYRARAEALLDSATPMVIPAIIGQAQEGKLDAAKFLLEMNGRYNPKQAEAQNAAIMVRVMAEAIIKHVVDPAIRGAILDEIRMQGIAMQALEASKP